MKKVCVDKLPQNCYDCPFNYDQIRCTVIHEVWEKDEYGWPKIDDDELLDTELKKCLDKEKNERFSKCPLIEIKN